jgi:SAM-dependent methyltransferase
LSDPTLALPFDQFQRYRLVADILDDLRGRKKSLKVLDVGGRTALLRLFLPKDHVFLVDVEESEEPGLVLGNGSYLPFKDNAVDAVVAFDTLEHVPPGAREAFLTECRRVARRWVVIAGPYATEGVVQAEELLTTFLREKMGVEHRYLAEHAEHGLPALDQTMDTLAGGGEARVASIGHANLERWLALMCLELYMDRDAPLRAIAGKYFEFYNAALYASDHSAPVYRHALVAALGDEALPSSESLLEPPQAPQGTFDSQQNVLEELLAFDIQRDVVQPEWKRLEQNNMDLLMDLEGHKDTLLILQEVNTEQGNVIKELRDVAIETVGNQDALLGEVGVLKEMIELERAERNEVVETLENDLGGHRDVIDAKSSDIERLVAEQSTLEATLASERKKHAEVVKALEDDLRGHRDVIDSKAKDLASLTEEQSRLQAQLASERFERDQMLETFQQDLDGHRQLVSAQTTEMEGLRAELKASLEQQAELDGAAKRLRSNLEQVQGQLAEHQRKIEGLTTDLEQRDGTIRELVDLRATLEAHVNSLNTSLTDKQSALDIVRGELSGHRQAIEALTALQRDRWANLLRALGLK